MNWPAHEVFILIAYALMSLINAHADISSGARYLHAGLTLHLQLYFMYASSEGAGESAYICKVAYDATDGISYWPIHTSVGLIANANCNIITTSRIDLNSILIYAVHSFQITV